MFVLEYDDEGRRLSWAGMGGGHVLSGGQGSGLASHGIGSSFHQRSGPGHCDWPFSNSE